MRIQAPTGSSTILPDQTSVRGLRLIFQEHVGREARYRGTRPDQICLVREAPLADAQTTALLRWEQGLLERLKHPVLPELVEAFEREGYFYLVTMFPEGLRLDQKMVTQSADEVTLMSWGLALYDLVIYLDSQQVHLDLTPDNLIKSRAGQIRLIDLRRTQRSKAPGPQLSGDMAGLGRCLYYWLSGGIWDTASPLGPPVSQPARDLVQQLLSGQFASGRSAFEALAKIAPASKAPDTSPGRIPLEPGSKLTCLAPGTRLAGYEVRYFTRGGMCLCYLGKLGADTRFIKEVSLEIPEAAQALRREFEVMRVLKHPNIVRAHQIFEQAGHLYLVLSYVEGTPLNSPDAPAANEERLLEWALQLCDTLQYLHQQKPPLIYRDLKPANLILSGGKVYLIDFGLVRTFKVGQAQNTEALGTFATASPEHFKGQTDARSDIYGLGATLYLLAHPGHKPTVPFSFPALRKVQPSYSEGFERLIQKCVERSPDARWPNAKTMAAEVKKLLQPFRVGKETPASDEGSSADVHFLPNLTSLVAGYARELATLVKSDTPLPQALETLARQCQIKSLARVLETVAASVKSGQPLSTALRSHPKVFSAAYVDLIATGDKSGRLGPSLDEGASLLEKEDLARRTRSAAARDTNPLETAEEKRKRRSVPAVALATLALGLGGGWAWGLVHHVPGWKPTLVGLGASLGMGFAAIFLSALGDTWRIRVVARARNLVEDAWTSYALGDTAKAEKELIEALEMARSKLGPTHLTTLTSLHSLANLCRQRRQYEKADEYYGEALAIYQRVLPPNHTARARLHRHWASTFEARKDTSKALEQVEQSLAIWSQYALTHPLELAEVLFYKGQILFDLQENLKAKDLFRQALDLQNAKLGLKSPLVQATMSYLTRVYVRLQLYQESEGLLTNLLVELEQDLETDYAALAEANLDLGLIRLEQDRSEEAEPYFLKALQLLQHYVGPNERLLRRVVDGYARIYGVWFEQQAGVVHLISVFWGEREQIYQSLERHPEWINARDNTGWGPLQWAIFIGRDDIVRWLLGRGADPGYDASHVMGPLHVACAWDQPESMFILLENDPDVNAGGPGGWSPVFWCALTGRARLLESLIKRGADVHSRDDFGRTPLHVAAAKNHLRVVATLLGAGARVNAHETHSRATPLHLAAERGHLAICDCLIFNGAELDLVNASGQTALDVAEKNQHQLLARAIRKHLQAGLGQGKE